MPGMESGSGTPLSPYDQMAVDALEGFCCASEQSYNQFLASFTHLSPGSAGSGQTAVPASGLNPLSGKMERSARGRERRINGVMEAVEEGQLKERDCILSADQSELDSSLEPGDFSQEDVVVTPDPGEGVLPGEVQEDMPVYLPSVCHRTQLEMTSTARGQRTQDPGQEVGHRPAQRPGQEPAQGQQVTPEEQVVSEEVLPFSLDEDFDYDHVTLSRKHPLLKTIVMDHIL